MSKKALEGEVAPLSDPLDPEPPDRKTKTTDGSLRLAATGKKSRKKKTPKKERFLFVLC